MDNVFRQRADGFSLFKNDRLFNNFPLLDADIKLDYANMSIEHAAILFSFLLVVIAVIFINGISIRRGDKEYNIGGVLRLIAKKDEDTLLKETLHRFSEEVDHDVNGKLYDLVDELNYQIEGLALKEHCYFTFEKFISILRTELEKRVRRDNLKEKLAKANCVKYTETIMKNIESRYNKLQIKINDLNCGESYANFSVIKNAVPDVLYKFSDSAKDILIAGCGKKIKRYKEEKEKFKTTAARKSSCEYPIEKNEGYIKDLGGGLLS